MSNICETPTCTPGGGGKLLTKQSIIPPPPPSPPPPGEKPRSRGDPVYYHYPAVVFSAINSTPKQTESTQNLIRNFQLYLPAKPTAVWRLSTKLFTKQTVKRDHYTEFSSLCTWWSSMKAWRGHRKVNTGERECDEVNCRIDSNKFLGSAKVK